jgi:hypothetical protein
LAVSYFGLLEVDKMQHAMSDSGKLILKLLIVLVIFPSIAYLASILSGFVLIWPLMLLPKSSQALGFTVFKVATTAIGIVGGFLLSWRVWPRTAVGPGHLSAED